MDFIKSPKRIILNEEQKNKFKNIKLISNKKRPIFDKMYQKLTKYEELKPADPLINRKNIKNNPIKFPSNTPTLTLPYFNHQSKNKKEIFTFIPNNNKNYNSNANTNNPNMSILLSSPINREIQINNYINMNRMLQKLIYCKKPPDNDELFSVDNIINLNDINNENKKKKYKDNKNESRINISDNLNSLDFPHENILNFESNQKKSKN